MNIAKSAQISGEGIALRGERIAPSGEVFAPLRGERIAPIEQLYRVT